MKRFMILFFALFVLTMSWESQKNAMAVFASGEVPRQSIRLRILANSDSPEDQQLKRQVRDQVIENVKKWSGEEENIQQARVIIQKHIPELQAIVNRMIKEKGFDYTATVQLRPTDFPTKMYGTQVFPAGQYEAVRIAIGQAAGQNWWCVLFPPLCFADIANGDTVTKSGQQQTQTKDVHVRFFVVDVFYKIVDFFRHAV
ncbi:stage II sporulation protein R [Aneurinibacillus terranovensis]|uniref:stage II sporulation protein R n=1 Tax=Aneurinibacillus terranovensis TaxID=278991 RepID=UPI00040D0FCB|nr:stage II sporulation protein R [Aneurinibacillus terranovensis]